MKIVSDKDCEKAAGPFKKWNKGNYTGAGVGTGSTEFTWINVRITY